MKVGDLTVIVCDEDGNWNETPITQSPYYLSLKNLDPLIFLQYNILLKKYSEFYDQEMLWKDFKDLALTIAIKGVDNEQMKNIDIRDGIVYDGQHRMSILFALYGKDYDISQWVELQK